MTKSKKTGANQLRKHGTNTGQRQEALHLKQECAGLQVSLIIEQNEGVLTEPPPDIDIRVTEEVTTPDADDFPAT